MNSNSMQPRLTEGVIWKQLLLYFFPILMGTFFQQTYNIVDTIIVGRIAGTTALAAVGSTGALISMVNGFFIGIGSGATVILSQFYGANDRNGVSCALHTGVTLATALGSIITFLGVFFGPSVLLLMKTPASCFSEASQYLRLFFLGSIGSMIYNMGAGILRAMGDSRRPTIFVILSCVVNIVLDLLFVAVFRMGVAGAAIATALSQWISAVMLILTLLRLQETPLTISKLGVNRRLLVRILQIGVPAGLQFVTFDLSNILIQSGINSFGDITMAAFTAYAKTDSLTWMISSAFGVSVTTFVGQNFGAQNYRRIRQSVWTCMAMSVALIGVLSFFMFTYRCQILGIYTADREVIAVGAYIISIVTPFNAVFMPVEVFAGTMRGVGSSATPTIITGSCVCLFRIIWLFTAVRKWHTVKMLALCYPISWILAAVVFYLVYLQGGWLRRRINESGMEPEKK